MNKIPASVSVLSIIGLVMAALGLFGFVTVWVMSLFLKSFLPTTSPITALYKDPIYIAVTMTTSVVGLIAVGVLTASAIGSLNLKPWARIGMLVYAYYAIVQAIFGIIFNFVYVIPIMTPPGAGPAAAAGSNGGVIGGMCGGVLGLIFPICIIIFFNRQNVKDAFNGIFPVAPTNFPVEFPSGGPGPYP